MGKIVTSCAAAALQLAEVPPRNSLKSSAVKREAGIPRTDTHIQMLLHHYKEINKQRPRTLCKRKISSPQI